MFSQVVGWLVTARRRRRTPEVHQIGADRGGHVTAASWAVGEVLGEHASDHVDFMTGYLGVGVAAPAREPLAVRGHLARRVQDKPDQLDVRHRPSPSRTAPPSRRPRPDTRLGPRPPPRLGASPTECPNEFQPDACQAGDQRTFNRSARSIRPDSLQGVLPQGAMPHAHPDIWGAEPGSIAFEGTALPRCRRRRSGPRPRVGAHASTDPLNRSSREARARSCFLRISASS